jgi:hypothetical protein
LTAFGADITERNQLYDEKVAAIHQALRGEPVTERGTRLYPDGRDLDRRVWQATFNPRTIADTAAAGDGLLLMRHSPATRDPDAFRAEQADRARQYLVACSATGHRPRIALSHTVFPAPDRRTAIAELIEGLDRWEAFKATGGGNLRDRLAAENFTYGHPEEIVAELLANVAVGYARRTAARLPAGGPPARAGPAQGRADRRDDPAGTRRIRTRSPRGSARRCPVRAAPSAPR